MILAVDGGNSKTDLALVDADGAVIAHARGPLSSPHHLGLDGCLDVLQQLVDQAGLDGRRADVAQVLLAGVDFPEEEARVPRCGRRARLGRARRGSATTRSPCCAPAPSAAGASRSPAAPASTASASAPDGRARALPGARGDHRRLGRRVRRRRGRALRRSAKRGRPRPRTAAPAARARSLRARTRRWSSRARSTWARSRERRIIELAPVVLGLLRTTPSRAGSATGSPTRSSPSPAPPFVGLGLEATDGRGARRRRPDARCRRPPARAHRNADSEQSARRLILRRTSLPPIVGAALLGLDAVGAVARRTGARASRARRGGRADTRRMVALMADVRYDQATRIYRRHRRTGRRRARSDDRRRRVPRLVGPSGSGKTTALRMLAGLEQVDAGAILIGDREVTDLPPKDRDVAMVFQNYALYPYLTVAANIGFPLRIARVPKTERARRANEVAQAARARAVSRAQARPALRRPAAAGRDGPRDHSRAERLPDGRAALEPRREASRPDARRDRLAAVAARDHDGLRDARPVGGDDARRSRRRARRRPAAAVRHAARALRAAGEHVRRRLHRLTGDEPLHGLVRERIGSLGGVDVSGRGSRPRL